MGTQRAVGRGKELTALRYLRLQGLQLLQENFGCPVGEIDLIMRDGHTVVFVEVRYRSQSRFGGAIESITMAKQRKIIRAANTYLQRHPRLAKQPCRMDVIAMDDGQDAHESIQWIQDAFQAPAW